MLDTNIVSHIVRGQAAAIGRLLRHPVDAVCVSAITAGEIRFGLARRPEAHRMQAAMERFLQQTEILPWDANASRRYGPLRAEIQRLGQPIGELDLLIAAHALAVGTTLVTNDAAFARVPGLTIEDWTRPVQ